MSTLEERLNKDLKNALNRFARNMDKQYHLVV